jgi:hypothetical protein
MLHDFRQVMQTPRGYLERCTRCGKTIHFDVNCSNAHYLSYHIRSALQTNDPLYYKEYPQTT